MSKKQQLKLKKFSDMDNWSEEDERIKNIKKGTVSDFDISGTLGQKISDTFKKYGLGILSVNIGNWIQNHHILLPEEKNKVEYRVSLGRYLTSQDLIDNFNVDTPEAYIKKFGEDKDYKDFMDMYKQIQNSEIVEMDKYSTLQFSIFLDKRVNNMNNEIGHIAVWQAAGLYLGIIKVSQMTSILGGRLDYSTALAGEEVHNFKTFLKLHNCQLSVDNLEDVSTWAYRVYKDSKFFGELRDKCPMSKRLIDELLSITVPSVSVATPYKN